MSSNISQGTVATQSMCDGIFNNDSAADNRSAFGEVTGTQWPIIIIIIISYTKYK